MIVRRLFDSFVFSRNIVTLALPTLRAEAFQRSQRSQRPQRTPEAEEKQTLQRHPPLLRSVGVVKVVEGMVVVLASSNGLNWSKGSIS